MEMFKNLKTSSKISLKFTLFTIVIVLIFGVLANLLFFRMRWRTLNIEVQWDKMVNKERMMKEPRQTPPQWQNEPEFKKRFINHLSITLNSEEYQELQNNEILKWYWISKLWDSYFYYHRVNDTVIVRDITPQIQSQKNLLITSIYLLIFSAILAYILSLYFVKSSLRKLNDLVDYVKWLDLNNLEKKYEIVWPENDEINVLAMKINSATDKINKQTLALKDFISNASPILYLPCSV